MAAILAIPDFVAAALLAAVFISLAALRARGMLVGGIALGVIAWLANWPAWVYWLAALLAFIGAVYITRGE